MSLVLLASTIFDGALAVLGAAILMRWATLAVLSAVDWLRRQGQTPVEPERWPKVAVVIPAYNEDKVVEAAVSTALAADYPDLMVVVVDDGSADDTWEVAETLAAHPRVSAVAQRPNQGKPAALDAGIAVADAEIVVTVDADTVLRADAVRHLVRPLALDPKVGAVAGNVKVGNRGTVLAIFQSLEYVTGLNLGRRAQHVLGCITTVPGAAGAWRTQAIADVGGVPGRTRIEDTDLTLKVQIAGWKVVYEPAAVAYTEAPQTLGGLVAQRTRWVAGYLQVVWLYRGEVFRHGTLGWLGLPDLIYKNVLAFVLLPLIIPALVRVAASFSIVSLLELLFGLIALDALATALAYVEDRERWAELLWVPARRVFWPWFLAFVLVRALWIEMRRGQVPWAKVDREGSLARAARDSDGPRVVR
ncbi:MAG: glycosyltransferase family 2 protein [Myxococcota bacterium]